MREIAWGVAGGPGCDQFEGGRGRQLLGSTGSCELEGSGDSGDWSLIMICRENDLHHEGGRSANNCQIAELIAELNKGLLVVRLITFCVDDGRGFKISHASLFLAPGSAAEEIMSTRD